jgi:hypothetical protein
MFPAELVGRIEASGESPIIHAKQYWRTVSQACAGAWDERPDVIVNSDGETEEVQVPYRLKELVGVAALARLGKDIIVSAIERSPFRNQQDTVVDYVSKLSEVDWRKSDHNPWVRTQAGFSGQRELYDMLYRLVYNDIRPGEQNE